MVPSVLAAIIGLVLLFLALLHFYWVGGGKWAFANSLPTSIHGDQLIKPRKTDSFIVGIGLLGFAIFVISRGELLNIPIPSMLSNYGLWVIGSIFIIRSVGDFKYLGFFKKVKSTEFAKLDSRIYSPLCLLLGLGVFVLEFYV